MSFPVVLEIPTTAVGRNVQEDVAQAVETLSFPLCAMVLEGRNESTDLPLIEWTEVHFAARG